MAAIQPHLKAKELVEKYDKETSLGICRQRILHALDMAKEATLGDRRSHWEAEAGFWMEVKQSIESVC